MTVAEWWEPEEDDLRYYQREALEAIEESLGQNRSALAVMATGTGKCLGRGTQVLMHDGTLRAVEEVCHGDYLMGPDSTPRIVRGVTEGRGPLYRIVPTKGEPWVCNWCHVLTLVHTETGNVVDIPLDEYLGKSKHWKHCHKLFAPGLIHYEGAVPLPVPPYFLGVWLGDGTKSLRGVSITKPDREIYEEVDYVATRFGLRVTVGGGESNPTLSIVGTRGPGGNRLTLTMRKLFPCAPNVRIPHEFMTAHAQDRRELLAGLIDTDGHKTSGCCEIVQKQRGLADDIALLARSLGLRVTERDKTVNGETYRRLFISGELSVIPTRIPRKRFAPRQQKKNHLRTGFKVEPIGDGEYFGFDLDGDHRFLLGDLTVTHNTVLFCTLASYWSGRVLVLAHRDELITQARKTLEAVTGEWVEIEKAEYRSHRARLVVGSVASVCRDERLKRLKEGGGISLIIIDEAHHAAAKTYKKIVQAFPNAKILGVTATPDRADEKALGTVFEDVPVVFDIQDGIESGYLVPIVGHRVYCEEIDLSKVKRSGKDLNIEDLDKAMLNAVEGICQKVVELCPDRQGLAFFPGVRSAEYAMERFNRIVPGSAGFVCGDTADMERRRIIRDFHAGRILYLCNCQIATEGFDAPRASMVIQARPTKSRSLYAQMVGRGTRVLPHTVDHIPGKDGAFRRRQAVAKSAKPDMVLLDFVGNSGKHDLCTVEDVLGGNYTPAEVKQAKKKEGGNVLQGLEEARKELEAMAEAMQKAQAKVSARVETFDPFKVFHMDRQPSARFGDIPPSPKQKRSLERAGIDASGMSKREASKMMSTVIKRRELGLASFKQLKALQKHGVQRVNISFERASEALTYLSETGWGRHTDYSLLHEIVERRRQPGEEG